jgi:hypothetical protein
VKNEEVLYLNFEGRGVFKNLKSKNVFENFKMCRKLNLRENNLETIEETNNFLALLGNFKNLEQISLDE